MTAAEIKTAHEVTAQILASYFAEGKGVWLSNATGEEVGKFIGATYQSLFNGVVKAQADAEK